jgi:hypothetical protein
LFASTVAQEFHSCVQHLSLHAPADGCLISCVGNSMKVLGVENKAFSW